MCTYHTKQLISPLKKPNLLSLCSSGWFNEPCRFSSFQCSTLLLSSLFVCPMCPHHSHMITGIPFINWSSLAMLPVASSNPPPPPPLHKKSRSAPVLSQCPANAQPMLSQYPAYAQPMPSLCLANAQPMLNCLSCQANASASSANA